MKRLRSERVGSRFESLEARALLASVVVSTLEDTGLPGSLRHAVAAASAGDTVDLRGLSGTLALTGGAIALDKDLQILGPRVDRLTISGNSAGRIFTVATGAAVRISHLTLGDAHSGTARGGAIHSTGALTLDRVALRDNIGATRGGAVYQEGGSLTVTDSTFTNNRVIDDGVTIDAICGGAIYALDAAVTVSGSTFAFNTAHGGTTSVSNLYRVAWGGGVMVQDGTVDVVNSTFYKNTATGSTNAAANGYGGEAHGGGIVIYHAVSASIVHCTIAENAAVGGSGSFRGAPPAEGWRSTGPPPPSTTT